ncbi:hypothetical protein ACTVNK_24165, partial [Serratia nevei]
RHRAAFRFPSSLQGLFSFSPNRQSPLPLNKSFKFNSARYHSSANVRALMIKIVRDSFLMLNAVGQ